MPQVKLTIPNDVYEIIKKSAKENYRTINSEINYRLAKTIRPGGNSTPYQLHYPEGVRSPIPETPYKITCDTTTQEKTNPKRSDIIGGTQDDYEKYLKEQKEKQEEETKVKRRSIISGPEVSTTTTSNGHKKHPLVWLDENDINANDMSEHIYKSLTSQYPDVTVDEFVEYQKQRQNRYTPDPNDPYDVMTNNPYLRKKEKQ